MPLPIALGVDFPYRWYRLLIAGEETPEVSYVTGTYARNLLPDLQNSIHEAEKLRLGPVANAWFMIRRFAELSRVLTGTEVHDVWVRDDPRPALSELLEIANALLRLIVTLIPGYRARRRRRARNQVKKLRVNRAARRLFSYV